MYRFFEKIIDGRIKYLYYIWAQGDDYENKIVSGCCGTNGFFPPNGFWAKYLDIG
jgi:hypothetical protein